MARNFEGLGVGIEVDDGGSAKKLQGLGRTVDDLWDGLKKAGTLGPKVGQALSKGLGKLGAKGGRALGGVTMALGGMIDKAMSPELDHAYSSMYAGFNKSFSALTAGMDISKKEMDAARKAIGGAAFGMGEDMDEAAKNWAAFRQQNIDLEKVLGTKGLTGTMKGLIKVTSVYGMEGAQLAVVTGGLVKGFGFTEEAVGSLADKIVASGKVFNMGKEAIQSWPAVFESLNNELADFGKTLSPEEIEQMTLSIVQLGGGLKEALGLAPQEAMELSRTMFTTIAGERKNIINMFRGMGGEFGEMAKGLMETGGDVDQMFQMMSQGDPLKFMDTLRAMSAEAEKQGGQTGIAFQRLSGVMTQALGPDVAFAMKGNWDKAQESMAKIPEALRGSEGMFKNIADEHWKSSITAGEAWDRMIQGMKARMFGLSKGEVNKWKKNMKSGFEDTFNVVSKLASDKGPLGELTRKMLAVQRVGLTALIPSLSGLAPILGGVASSSLPVLTAMGAMGLNFSTLGSMALKGGVLFGLFYLLKEGPAQAIKNIKEMASKIWESLGKMFPDLKERAEGFFGWLANADMEAVVSGWFADIDIAGFFGELASGVGGVEWGKIFGQVMGAAKGLLKGVGGVVGSMLKEIDWGQLVSGVVKFGAGALSAIGEAITSLLGELFNPRDPATGEVIQANIATTLINAFVGAFSIAKDMLFSAVGGLFTGLFSGEKTEESVGKLSKIIVGALTALLVFSGKFRTAFLGGFKGMFMKMKRLSKSNWRAIGRHTRMSLKKMGRTMRRGASMIGGVGLFMGLMEGLKQVKVRMENVSKIMEDELIPDFAKTSMAGKEAFRGITDTIDSVFMGIPGMIGNALGVSSQDFDNFYYDVVGGAEKFFATVYHGFSGMVEGMSIGWDTFKNVVAAGWDYIKASATFAGKSIKDIWVGVTSHLEGGIDTFITTFQRLFMSMRHSMEMAMFEVQDTVVSIIRKMGKLAPDSLVQFADKFEKHKKAIGGAKGLEKQLQKEKNQFELQAKEREKARKAERDAATREKLEAAVKVMEAGQNVKNVYMEGAKRQYDATLKTQQNLARELGDIDKDTEKTKKESAEAEKRAAEEQKKGSKRKEQQAKKEERKKKGKKGKASATGVTPEATAPSAKDRVARGEQMIVQDMMALIDKNNAVMVKHSDMVAKAVDQLGKSPIDVYVGFDGKKYDKARDKRDRKAAAGRGIK